MKHYRVTIHLRTSEDLELDGPHVLLAEVDEKEFHRARPGDGGEGRITDYIKDLAWAFLLERGRIPSGLIAGLCAERMVLLEEQAPDWNLEILDLEPNVAKDGVKLLCLPQLL